MDHTPEELKDIMREVLLENIDKIAAAVASKLKVRLKDHSTFIRNKQRLEFINKYKTLCAEAYTDCSVHKMSSSPLGKAIVELARQELNYKRTTYSGDIFRSIGITYLKSVGKWNY